MTKIININPGDSEDPLAADLAEIHKVVATAPLNVELGECRGLMLQSFRDNFTSSATADGQAWAPRKNPGDGHPLLMESGSLLQAVTAGGPGHVSRIGDRDMELGVDQSVDQGGIPAAGWLNDGTSRMPPRPFLGVKEEHLQEMDDILIDGLLEKL